MDPLQRQRASGSRSSCQSPHGRGRRAGTARHIGKGTTGVPEIPQPAGWQDRHRTPGDSRGEDSLSPSTSHRAWHTVEHRQQGGKLCPSVRRNPLRRHLFIPQTFSECLRGQSSPEVHSRSPRRPPAQTSALSMTSLGLESWTQGLAFPCSLPKAQGSESLLRRARGRLPQQTPGAAVQG